MPNVLSRQAKTAVVLCCYVNLNFLYERRTRTNVQNPFSNELIIHEEKTKEITTVKEVWKCDPNYHKIR